MIFWSILAILGHSGPLNGSPPGVHILFYHSVLLPPHKISVKIMNICCLSELDGSKLKKFKILVNFIHLKSFGTPLLGPRGLHSRLSFSTNLSALDPCNNNKTILPE